MTRYRTEAEERERWETMLAEDAYRAGRETQGPSRKLCDRACVVCWRPTRFDLCRLCDGEAYAGRTA